MTLEEKLEELKKLRARHLRVERRLRKVADLATGVELQQKINKLQDETRDLGHEIVTAIEKGLGMRVQLDWDP